MYRLLVTILLVSFCCGFRVEAAENPSTGVNRVLVPSMEDFAARVFVGSDSEMPTDGDFDIAIHPTLDKSGQPIVPIDAAAAMEELWNALPRWYLIALKKSRGDKSCVVAVNQGDRHEVDYTFEIASWYWSAWKLDSNQTPLRRTLNGWGLDQEARITPALEVGFCEYVKTRDRTKAIDTIKQYGLK
jgi:hypothetical protein